MSVNIDVFFSDRNRPGSMPSVPSTPATEVPDVLNPPGSNPNVDSGIGIRLNGKVIGGVKWFIQSGETLTIPEFWQYNIHKLYLDVDGVIDNEGEINITESYSGTT